MRKSLILATVALAFPMLARAQAPAPAPPRPRPSLDLSIEMARGAIADCEAKGYHAMALVLDAAGVPVVMLWGAGSAGTWLNVQGKATLALAYKMDSGDVLAKAKTDPALAKAIAADPKFGKGQTGGVLIKVGPQIIGAIAAGGAPGADKDEACARAGLAKVASRLR